eukprot:4940890-Heterocapsa_arctica.AAC.1
MAELLSHRSRHFTSDSPSSVSSAATALASHATAFSATNSASHVEWAIDTCVLRKVSSNMPWTIKTPPLTDL